MNSLDPDPSEIDALVTFVRASIERTLSSDPGVERLDAFADELRRTLVADDLSTAERDLLVTREEGAFDPSIDALLTARLERAVRAASPKLGSDAAAEAARGLPKIVVARGDGVIEPTFEEDGTLTIPTLPDPTLAADGGGPFDRPPSLATIEDAAGDDPHLATLLAAETVDALEGATLDGSSVFVLTNVGGQRELVATLSARGLVEQSLSANGSEDGPTESALGPFSQSTPIRIVELTSSLASLEHHVVAAMAPEEKRAVEGQVRGKDLVGQVLNSKYRIERRIGKGGFGTVYQATDLG
ncbi:MAG: hypothetical protein AAGA20_04805, partial [Planctomycetota bacterium]